MLEIKNLQRWNQDQVDLHSPADFVPRTTGYLRLTGMDAQTLVTPDRKRCQKRMIKKGRMDVEYLQQVQTEHLFLKKPSGKTSSDIQELNDMIRLDDIENIKRRLIGRKTRVRRLKAELEHRLEAYKRSYELGEENKEMRVKQESNIFCCFFPSNLLYKFGALKLEEFSSGIFQLFFEFFISSTQLRKQHFWNFQLSFKHRISSTWLRELIFGNLISSTDFEILASCILVRILGLRELQFEYISLVTGLRLLDFGYWIFGYCSSVT
ncbi:hypothetical protein R6Q59_001497 [Mikania micrantha]